jgi:hypothetical protein
MFEFLRNYNFSVKKFKIKKIAIFQKINIAKMLII